MVTTVADKMCARCTFVGDAGIGKTSVVLHLTNDRLVPSKDTVFENYAGSTCILDEKITISAFDCSSKSDHACLRTFAYKDSEVFVLCYSVIDRNSFKNISAKWLPEIIRFMGKKVPIVLVATQTDRRQVIDIDRDFPITTEEGVSLSKQISAEFFIECSSRDSLNIEEVFKCVGIAKIKNKKKKSLVQRFFGK